MLIVIVIVDSGMVTLQADMQAPATQCYMSAVAVVTSTLCDFS